MRLIKSILQTQKIIQHYKKKGLKIGFVPTMGALHQGHASLLQRCRKENDISILSIFVNPKQFHPAREDFSSYPRNLKKDKLLAKKEKVDIIFYPSAEEMYPIGHATYIDTEPLSNVLCGKSRPGHFRGVTTIVGKLLNIVNPDTCYLGQKDAQQALIIKKMVADLNYPVTIQICPTVRQSDGLALSSRNVYLNAQERKQAPILYQSLQKARKMIAQKQRSSSKIIQYMKSLIQKNSNGRIDYIACVNAENLTDLKRLNGNILIALAVNFRKARLIDNILVSI